jgi:FlaG/FlaF family flagellin (archaellin)
MVVIPQAQLAIANHNLGGSFRAILFEYFGEFELNQHSGTTTSNAP